MFGKVGSFFSESKQELAKANWPTREELMGSTALVIVVTLIMSAFIFGVDFILSILMRIAMAF
ncbi:MAG: preprotein translocase subunit SecE [Candidatus Omnitrophica bacterium]|nr:preprotein translocase subunit SecE [Candidatus Omnitrophota bacterium]